MVPAGSPLAAMVREVRSLRQLLMLAFAGEQGASLLVTAIAEVLACDADG